MRLVELEALPSFALLGPGFGGEPFVLLRDLTPTTTAPTDRPRLVFVPFEERGSAAELFAPEAVTPLRPSLEPPGAELPLRLLADDYPAKVERLREAIAAGDVYQVCLTARAELPRLSGSALFALLCARAVPRFAAWVRLPDGRELVSASPELFFETRGSYVHTQPMKGTAPPEAAAALEASEKDRAELAMITDLLRNDLVPICQPRSVRVEHARRVLELPYALQTVSDVVGTLADGMTPLEVLSALHPGGSVSGAPKTAALRLIRALESTPRGAYCGALGLVTDDRSTFSLLIRTAEKTPAGWIYGVGGGIVYDSDPRAELDELHVKLGALRCPTRS
ncbi:MAG: chorismate-binding protein [Deltaproteobacteria bacterium]|nr:chorismate-binding protein [Deltaproteobacteria bacterium]